MDKIKKSFLIVFFLLFSLTLKAGEFPIRINDISGLNAPWPIIASIPFPEGELIDSSCIRIMSGEREVPSQIDVTATWRDGSIRWTLAGFTASPQGNYRVEFGKDIKRGEYPNPLKVTEQANGGFEVNTGVAIYRFDKNQLLPEEGWLISGKEKRQVLKNSGAGAYLIDNSRREARVSGEAAEITNEVLKEGPNRLAIKRSGWYVTTAGEKLARADVWFYFTAGVPYIKITHTLIFTEDTNKVWFKDYGLEFKTPSNPVDIYSALGETTNIEVKKTPFEGADIYFLQADYPHFAERTYKAFIGKRVNNIDTVISEIKTLGDWAYGDYDNFGITVVMPWLAERFPKEISFGEKGARAVFWSGRSGKELDFRGKTLVKDYWQTWAEKGLSSPGVKKLSEFESNAQGSARTHDIWFLPHQGTYNPEKVKQTATTAARAPLTLADPVWLCRTEAMGYPMLHKDVQNFPREEAMISECWQRYLLPYKAFPLTGFIGWGDFTTWYYQSVSGRIMPTFHILTQVDRYGVRREPWRLYARSGERTYYDYAHKFSRFTGDWYLIHHSVPNNPKKQGRFMSFSREGSNLPFVWGQTSSLYVISAGEIGCWLMEYFLTGDERSYELLKMIKESVKKDWKINQAIQVNQSKVVRELVTLSIIDWDKDIVNMANEVAHSMFDLTSQNGIKMFQNSYGTMYKDHRTSHNTAEYYLETKDELAKEAFLKLMDQRYRFDRRYNPIAHKNYDGFTTSIAYWLSGDERFRRAAEQTLYDALYYVEKYSIEDVLSKLPKNPLDWKNLPTSLTEVDWHNPFIGLPTALKLVSEKGWSNKRTPLVIKSKDTTQAKILFNHKKGTETKLSFYFTTLRPDVKLEISKYPDLPKNTPLKDVKIEIEKRVQWPERLVLQPDDIYHAYITLPAKTPNGLYFLSTGGREPFTLLDITGAQAALYCPEGLWAPSGTPIRRSGEGAYGRAGEGMPIFFQVPANLKNLEIYVSSFACIKRPDGSVAVNIAKENTGKIIIPVEGKGGVWSIEPYTHNFKGATFSAFYKFLNIEPVVTFGLPNLFPETYSASLTIQDTPQKKTQTLTEFTKGISGKSAKLTSNNQLVFDTGEKLPQGGYTYFPGMVGTVEFWFKPDISTNEIILFPFTIKDFPLITAPHIKFLHKYWSMGGVRNLFSRLQISLTTDKKEQFGAGPGYQGEYFFDADKWVHIACTWDIIDGEKGTEGDFSIFVDGTKLLYKRASYGVTPLTGQNKINIVDENKNISIGPFEGCIDNLRFSDIVRYNEDFIPTKDCPTIDKNTRAIFNFDDTFTGYSFYSKKSIKVTLTDIKR
ncbi:LamG domain-containing protein [bacterium]|nr:LamG domain-containing protein [bacterium]